MNFTRISEKLTPGQLVEEIDYCFGAFDEIITSFGLEKIKTIGDAYLAVSGVPNPSPNHAHNTAKAALAILGFMDQYRERNLAAGKPNFELRIGLHSGSLVAGIVGIKKFAYDIWGDTVNTAARMEQSGEPGKINISANTYELIKNEFTCTSRGPIEAKGKGVMEMYFVEK